jgi:oxygen-independent coproporphyrinogen-3 oxidase
MKAGVYVHIPFCISKCHYCSFNSIPYKEDTARRYMGALSRETDAAPEGIEALSLYIGGGTPTVLPGQALCTLLDRLRRKFKAGPDVEATLEANPGTLEGYDISAVMGLGINRVSLGVQSFDPRELEMLGRRHGVEDVRRSVSKIRGSGIDNINIDLIYSLPGQDIKGWSRSLEDAIGLAPAHISLYDLSLEAGTHLYTQVRAGKVALPPESAQVEMYLYAVERLESAGYARYEISNFARPGRECVHNLNYWSAGPYLGLGAGAYSCMSGSRTKNIPDVDGYARALEAGRGAVIEREELTPGACEREFIMLALRKAAGFGLDGYKERFGRDFTDAQPGKLERLVEAGYMKVERGRAWLTIKGVLASNAVIKEFF